MSTPPLASVAVSFFDPGSGVSALALQHLRCDGRTVVVYHDASSPAAAARLLGAVGERLIGEMQAGGVLSMIDTSMPEHPLESFAYAQVSLWHAPTPGRINAGSARRLTPASVAQRCGITVAELERTEQLVVAVHRPRACTFPGFRQVALGLRGAVDRAAERAA